MDHIRKFQNNKKRPGVPLINAPKKVPKTTEKQTPKVESVDVPTKAPKLPKQPTLHEVPTSKPKSVASFKNDAAGEIQVGWLERKEGAKPHYKSVNLVEHSRPTSGLEIMERPTKSSQSKSKDFLKWFLWPLPIEEFKSVYYEKRVVAIKRGMADYWNGWFDSSMLRQLVENGKINYGTDIDVTMYKNGQRFSLNIGNEIAESTVLWDLFENCKCSVRSLRPQEHSSNVSRMLALLEENFLSGFGCNSYYTPAGSQGFAPHWDDVEAFVLQVEGTKHWKIHGLQSDDEQLPRFSSRNFAQSEVGPAVLEVSLQPGDMLYFPRGTVHQAQSDPSSDSFHLTVSCSQKNCWADLLDVAVQAALIQAAKTMPAFREGLPTDYGSYMGVMYSDLENDERRKAFLTKVMALCSAFSQKYLPELIDDAADKMMCRFMYDRQPPQAILSSEEQGLSQEDGAAGNSMEISHSKSNGTGHMTNDEEYDEDITDSTRFRLVSKHCLRLVIEENASIYYASQNTTVYHEVDSMKIVMPLTYAESIEFLVNSYPKYVSVSELPLETEEERLDLVNELLDKQIAMVE